MNHSIEVEIDRISRVPAKDTQAWLVNAEASVDFLKKNEKDDEIVIYVSSPSVLIHGILAKLDAVDSQDLSDLQNRQFPRSDDSWKIQYELSYQEGRKIYLEPPLASAWGDLVDSEQLVFRRHFNQKDDELTPVEFSQKVVHSLGLNFVPERNAYCRIDSRGDVEEVIKVFQKKEKSVWDATSFVTMHRKDLDRFMALSGTSLIWRFDFTRVRWGNFLGWGEIQRYEKSFEDIYYHGGIDGNGSFCAGVFVARSNLSIEDLVQEWIDEESSSNRKYATFKIYDRKNDKNTETSCSPEHLSNYFQESDLPWEISPAFFRPEVLHRFKADPDKFTIDERSITCRNAWHLKTYDINDAGQVHTYIGYLADLPFEEQLYWQSFNEWPKSNISHRAYLTDILGSWEVEADPLSKLKRKVLALDADPPEWWIIRGEELAKAVHYPATESSKEWGDEILALDQLVVEGFRTRKLRLIAESLNAEIDPMWQSLRLLREILRERGFSEGEAGESISPLAELHSLRTILRGHASGSKKSAEEKLARQTHGSFRGHFLDLTRRCDQGLYSILDALLQDKGILE